MSCKDCQDRHYLCHSTCERYIAWKKKLDERNALIREEKRLNNDIWASSRHANKRNRKGRPYADNRS